MTETFPRPFNADYELLGLLGKGGMGSNVYKARQIRLGRPVALKVLDSMGDEEAEKRFFSEAQAMRDFNHENLVPVYDYGTQDGKMFIAMKFIGGESLADTIKKKKTLPVEKAMGIALEVAKGLRYAHKSNVIHRDIKPANIMMMDNEANEICIIDFGISIAAGSQRLTNPGMTMGTPEYMSPEQCQNKNVTLQSDIYSLGIVLYEMLSGDPPFTSNGTGAGASLAILNKHMHATPDPLKKIPKALEAIINKCLAKKTQDRYANFSEFIKDLVPVMNASAEKEAPKTTTGRLSKQELMVFSLLLLLPILALFVSLLLYISMPKIPQFPPSINYLNPMELGEIKNEVDKGDLLRLFDKDYGTTWNILKHTALTGNGGRLLTIKFNKPVFISHLGFAPGDQKFSKPKDIWIYWGYNNKPVDKQEFSLKDMTDPQYVPWTPREVDELTFVIKSVHNASADNFAISEIMLFGMEM
ncbi:MAG: serine/threonine protein kinase [Fibromonadales bacterium]|nr:serine/threonine protein kinase [Fibromonadales bacterium]